MAVESPLAEHRSPEDNANFDEPAFEDSTGGTPQHFGDLLHAVSVGSAIEPRYRGSLVHRQRRWPDGKDP